MIEETIYTLNLLIKKGFSKEEALQIILIEELKEIKEVLKK
jgi:hypothetical protein